MSRNHSVILCLCMALLVIGCAGGGRESDEQEKLFGAWDLYYSAPALTSNHPGSMVEKGSYPLLVRNDEGRSYSCRDVINRDGRRLTVLRKPVLNIAKGNYFALDAKLLRVDLDETPFVRVGYKCEKDLVFGVESKSCSEVLMPESKPEEGMKYSVIDLSQFSGLNAEDPSVKLAFMSGSGKDDIALSYVAFFKTAEAAENFDLKANKSRITANLHKPVPFRKVTRNVIEKYNKETDKALRKLKNLPDIDPKTIKGTVWYVSSLNGDHANDGHSPESPLASPKDLVDFDADGKMIPKVKPGDGVFFERGSVFYATFETRWSGNYAANIQGGVTYSAYGKGPKPIFANCLDLNGSRDWLATGQKNVWMLDHVFPYKASAPVYNDVGNITFEKDGFIGWGVKLICTTPDSVFHKGFVTTDVGVVSTGFECYDAASRPCEDLSTLKHNLEFIQDYQNGRLYVYCDKGNPGEYYDKVIVSVKGHALYANAISDEPTVIHNLAIQHAGSHGIAFLQNTTITGCEIEWIGGSLQGNDVVRFGNGIECYGDCEKIRVSDNYVRQCYDTGITVQGGTEMTDVIFERNVIENCTMPFEIFNTAPKEGEEADISDILMRNNIIRYAGYGLGSTTPAHERKGSFIVCGQGTRNVEWKNVVFEHNLCLFTCYLGLSDGDFALGDSDTGLLVRNNTYIANSKVDYHTRSCLNMFTNYQYGTYYPYTQQYVQYMNEIGIDSGSKYYWYEDFLKEYPHEAEGAYRFAED